MTSILVHKTICRLDYPASFELIDRLGHHTDLLQRRTSKPPFEGSVSNINPLDHVVLNTGRVKGDPYRLSLSHRTMDVVAEFKNGIEPDDLAQFPILSVMDAVISGLTPNLHMYERVGARSYVLVSRPGFTFEALRSAFFKLNHSITSAFSASSELNDIGVVFEGRDSDRRMFRVGLGPYQASERAKYFTNSPPDLAEGLILDIDVWIEKLELPRFTLERFVRRHQQVVAQLTNDVVNRVGELVKVESNGY